ncbi:putative disease resistance protein RGA4 isoform X1 [Cryptomeria japonica]|uniref:putative disease resistance protein RGA4 isoform X1 n=1 Tax=Cryptomeria japonica TaxID=3369 RepID=UPI0027D9DFA2|nr:putative disease resistance protein RGA4 isoform X1 [Cryptomeria japonica]
MNISQLSKLPKILIKDTLSIRMPPCLGVLISRIINLIIDSCPKVECLPSSLGKLSSLTHLEISSCPVLECLPSSLGDLSSLTHLKILGCGMLECLPPSLGDLSSLTHLEIAQCGMLECLPPSLSDLFSLTHLTIHDCGKLKCLPAPGRLIHLEQLKIWSCPISQVDILEASLPIALGNLKEIVLTGVKVPKISISEGCCPCLERLKLGSHDLVEIEALPANLERLEISNCPKLNRLPSFAHLTSLREFELKYCGPIEKIGGLEYSTSLEILKVVSKWVVPRIENLNHMPMRRLEFIAEEGSSLHVAFTQ